MYPCDKVCEGLPEALYAPCTAMELGVWIGLSHTEVTRRRQALSLDVKKSNGAFSKVHREFGLELHHWLLADTTRELELHALGWTARKLKNILVGRAQIELLDLHRLAQIGFTFNLENKHEFNNPHPDN